MSKNEKNLITVNDIEYNVDDFTETQKTMLNHIYDLDRKLSSSQFNLDQLNVGREAFIKMLASSIEEVKEEAAQQDIQYVYSGYYTALRGIKMITTITLTTGGTHDQSKRLS